MDASFVDLIKGTAIALSIVFTVVIGAFVFYQVGDHMENEPLINNSGTAAHIQEIESWGSTYDWVPLTAYIAILLICTLAARLVPTEFAFVVISYIILVFLLLVQIVLGYSASILLDQTELDVATNQLPITAFMVEWWVYFTLAFGIIIIIALHVEKDG